MPKIVGTYEKGIQHFVEEIINGNYSNIVDIGCAEGYYAVGLAYRYRRKGRSPRIFAYDVNSEAIENLKALARLNNVEDLILGSGRCDFDELNSFTDGETFVICDIEGAEIDLIDPAMAPNLVKYDFLIEVHDGGAKSSVIKDRLRKRFERTHSIEVVLDSPRSVEDYDLITWTNDMRIKELALNEFRVYGLEWMFLKRKPT